MRAVMAGLLVFAGAAPARAQSTTAPAEFTAQADIAIQPAASPAAAPTPVRRFSVVLELGSNSFREALPSGEVVSDRNTAAQLAFGVQMTPLWRLDLGALKLGRRWKTGGLLGVTKEWHFSDEWGAFLRFGIYQRRTDRLGLQLFGETERMRDSDEPYLGGGIVWRFAPGVSAALGWTAYELPIFGTDGFLDSAQGANVASLAMRFAF